MENNNSQQCESCKGGFKLNDFSLMGLSLFILGTSIYGTIKLVSNIIEYFSH